jgi:hypothetical protein
MGVLEKKMPVEVHEIPGLKIQTWATHRSW